MKSDQYIRELYLKYLSNKIAEKELQELFDCMENDQERATLEELIQQTFSTESGRVYDQQVEDLVMDVKYQLRAKLQPERERKINWKFYTAVAAAIALMAIGVSYYLHKQHLLSFFSDEQINVAQQTIQPGGDKAVLILSDGRQVSLSDSTDSVITDDKGTSIAEVKAGMINYLKGAMPGTADEKSYNKILVPKGGQYKVVLPDGSKAWLNAGSSLRYALSFGVVSRVLELTGEGYFEVVKNKQLPFTVKSSTLEVTALGTQFNVNTYSNEPYRAATLVEGSLRVSDTKSQKTVLLTPGQQALTAAVGLQVRAVNSNELTAWKDGLFVINKAGLEDVMRQVERWYNVTVDVKLPKSANTFSGEFPRDIPLSDFLRSLETTTGIKFKIEGRRIVGR